MPMYRWVDKHTGLTVEVVRTFDEWEKHPDRVEAAAISDSEFENAEWSRVIGIPGVVKGYGWGGGKGHW